MCFNVCKERRRKNSMSKLILKFRSHWHRMLANINFLITGLQR